MMNCKLLLTLLGALAMVSSSSLCAQEEVQVRGKKAAAPAAENPAKADDDEDEWLHIHNVDVYPVVGPVIRGGEILIKNGKIEAVGMDLDVPEGAETLDGQGHRAYPGLVSLNGQGLVPRASGDPSFGSAPNSLWTLLGLSSGITTVVSGSTAVKLQRGSVDDYVLRRNLFTPLFYASSNPKAKAQLRNDLRKVYEYLRRRGDAPSARERRIADAKAKAESSSGKPAPKKPSTGGGANAADAAARKALGSAARYLPLMKGEAVAVFNANDAADIRAICDLVETFRFRAVIRGAVEGWTVAGDMGRAGVSAIVSPRVRQDPDANVSRPTGSTIANASILHDHGVRVAIAAIAGNVELDGGAGRDAISLPYSAGAAVRGGLPEKAAIVGVTLEAARTYGLDDRIGSLEPGKDADLVICDGELLHYATHVQWAIVNGRVCYDKQADYSFLRQIRPRRGDDGEASSAQWWPRRFGEMADDWSYDPEADWKRRHPAPEPKPEAEGEGEKKPKADEGKKEEPAEPEKAKDEEAAPKKDKVSSGGR